MKLIEPPTLDVGPKISSSSMATTATNVIVFTALPSSVLQQQHRGADHDTTKAEERRRDFDSIFQPKNLTAALRAADRRISTIALSKA
ncbi:hypothetical protein JQ599_13685 [Bradyrhizobium diazoefficiens]|nr:hypothetical protein [Bradyrhizobium diazoefficiens]MBR0700953.1 hypothetical protein [Bradyrhizobium diazoefficiens]MBR0769378.1 hypothetical protein [Bradyrhizobium diazoefficiens]